MPRDPWHARGPSGQHGNRRGSLRKEAPREASGRRRDCGQGLLAGSLRKERVLCAKRLLEEPGRKKILRREVLREDGKTLRKEAPRGAGRPGETLRRGLGLPVYLPGYTPALYAHTLYISRVHLLLPRRACDTVPYTAVPCRASARGTALGSVLRIVAGRRACLALGSEKCGERSDARVSRAHAHARKRNNDRITDGQRHSWVALEGI